jgi:hypothetical protein
MDKEYLLTYKINGAGYDYEWFDTEDEIRSRIEQLEPITSCIEAMQVKIIKYI